MRIYALNVPAFGESAATLEAFVEQAGITYTVMSHQGTAFLFDFEGNNTFPYPRDVIVDQTGTVVYTSNNYDAQGVLEIIEDLLASPPGG